MNAEKCSYLCSSTPTHSFKFSRTLCFKSVLSCPSPLILISKPPGPSLLWPCKHPLHHHPLQLLTVPEQETTTLMDTTDGLSLGASQPRRSVCSAGSEAGPPHEIHVVTGNKRRAPIHANSHVTHIPVTGGKALKLVAGGPMHRVKLKFGGGVMC